VAGAQMQTAITDIAIAGSARVSNTRRPGCRRRAHGAQQAHS
jgi:hypothetical protein